jgi:hypothetical protein
MTTRGESDRPAAAPKDLAPRSVPVAKANAPDIPLPTAFGVYAIGDGQLIELDPLPIGVPDPRVAISTAISTPSRVHMPAGDVQFVVFRRQFIGLDRATLRVVARVARSLTFDAKGKANTVEVEISWVVRGNAYPMKVAPLPDNPEMIVIRPEDKDIALPAGRYA